VAEQSPRIQFRIESLHTTLEITTPHDILDAWVLINDRSEPAGLALHKLLLENLRIQLKTRSMDDKQFGSFSSFIFVAKPRSLVNDAYIADRNM